MGLQTSLIQYEYTRHTLGSSDFFCAPTMQKKHLPGARKMPVRTRSGHTTAPPTDTTEDSVASSPNRSAAHDSPERPRKKKRVVTSAIPGLSIAEVRKGLDQIRQSWANRDEEPFRPHTMSIQSYNVTAQEFCLRFVLGQHLKRFNKSKSRASK